MVDERLERLKGVWALSQRSRNTPLPFSIALYCFHSPGPIADKFVYQQRTFWCCSNLLTIPPGICPVFPEMNGKESAHKSPPPPKINLSVVGRYGFKFNGAKLFLVNFNSGKCAFPIWDAPPNSKPNLFSHFLWKNWHFCANLFIWWGLF